MPTSEPAPAPLRRVLVVGAGLLGTSVGLALRRRGVEVHLTDALPGRAARAAKLGAGRAGAPSGPVDLAVVATPPGVVGETVVRLQREGAATAYTDVASVKSRPRREVEGLGGDLASYVGGHPLAGSERSGPGAARSDLFEGRPWVLTPDAATDEAALSSGRALVEACGAVPVVMDAATHDEAVAVVSHLPHLLAVLAATRLDAADDAEVAICGQGVRDVTRVAAGDPGLWVEILRDNAAPVLSQLLAVRDDLDRVVAGLEQLAAGGSRQPLEEVLTRGVAGRARIPGKHGGPATTYATVPVVVPDRPGELARLFAAAGEAGVNIEDLRLEHSPGQPVGLAELSVRPEAAEGLVAALRAGGWVVHTDR